MKTGRSRCVIVAYDFPPRVRSGSFRPMRFARSLARTGRETIVFTAAEREDPRPVDWSLCGELPSRLSVRRVFSPSSLLDSLQKAFARAGLAGIVYRMRRSFLFPDEKVLWSLALVPLLLRLRLGSRDLLVTTSPPWSVHVTGLMLRILTGVRWIADHRDPWTGNPHFRGRSVRTTRLHRTLERACHRRADAVITASRLQRDSLVDDFGLPPEKITALYSGYDEASFENAVPVPTKVLLERLNTGPTFRKHVPREPYVILYTGACYGDYAPDAFLGALAGLVRDVPKLRAKIRCVFLLTDGLGEMRDRIRGMELEDVVAVVEAVPHAELPACLVSADCLLLFVPDISGGGAWVPGKTFEYLGSGSAVLSVVPEEGEVAGLVRRSPAGRVVSPGDLPGIRRALQDLVTGGSSPDTAGRALTAESLGWTVLSKEFLELAERLSPSPDAAGEAGRQPSVAIATSGLGVVSRGAERFTVELARALGPHLDVTVFGGGNGSNGHRRIHCTVRSSRLATALEGALPDPVRRFVKRCHLDPIELERLTFSLSLLPRIAALSPDVLVHSQGFWGGVAARIARRLFGVRVVSVGHGQLGGAIEDLICRPDRYVTVNPAIVEDLGRRFPELSVTWLPTMVDTDVFRPRSSPVRPALERPVVILAGALEEEKRIGLAISAVSEMREGSLLVLGEGSLGSTIEAQGRRELGEGRFELTSVPADRMADYYNAADVFTMPSVREAFPLAMLEAMACDLPVVTVREGARALIGRDCAVFCNPENAREYAEALTRACSDRSGGRSRTSAGRYDRESVGHLWRQLLEEVARA